MKLRFDRPVLGIACTGFALSLAFSFLILPHIAGTHNVNLDADANGALASNIYAGAGMKYDPSGPPALDRGPVYPYLVAALFSLSGGYALGVVQVFQALLHSATTVLVFLIGMHVYDRATALRAQLLCAVHPILLWYTGRIWMETTLVFMVTLTALAALALYRRLTLVKALGAGAAMGVASLTKSVVMLFPLLLLVLLVQRHRTKGLQHGLVVIAVCGLVILPWTMRNYRIAEAFVPVQTSLGFNMIQGDVIGEHWPKQWCCNLDYWRMGQARVDSLLAPHGIPSFREVEADRLLLQTALRRYASEPLFVVRRAVANFFLFWSLSESPLKSALYGALQWLLLLAAFAAYMRYGKSYALLTPIVALAVYYIVLHASIVGWARYSMPMIPLLTLIAMPIVNRVISRSVAG
jgi:4-amino-4-deoxy-L-arabinose transferase-like glycosyltransferase